MNKSLFLFLILCCTFTLVSCNKASTPIQEEVQTPSLESSQSPTPVGGDTPVAPVDVEEGTSTNTGGISLPPTNGASTPTTTPEVDTNTTSTPQNVTNQSTYTDPAPFVKNSSTPTSSIEPPKVETPKTVEVIKIDNVDSVMKNTLLK